MTIKYDLAILGAGPGGYAAAVRAAQLGLKTVCIDKRDVPGGTCLNVGCIPSKTLLHATEKYAQLKLHGHDFGIHFDQLQINISELMKKKEQVVQGLCNDVLGLFIRFGVEYVVGQASFVDPRTIEVANGKKKILIEAKNIILATGSEPISLQQLSFDERQVVSSTGALSLTKVPPRMIVIGAGVIGVELASVYNRLGTKVTIVEMLDHICPAMDTMISQSLLQSLKKQGMEFLLSSQVMTAVVQPDEVILTIQQGERLSNLSADVVLVAVGRRPYSQGMNLDKAGVVTTLKGFVEINGMFQTSQAHIYAVGDLVEGVMLAHRASEEGIAVVEMLAGRKSSVNYLAIPNVIYTHPEVAAVGLTEKEAIAAGLNVKCGISSFKGNPRARCMGDVEGVVKIVGDMDSGRLLGMHLMGPQASELIACGALAIEKLVKVKDLAYLPFAHPTLSEAIKEAAFTF